MLATQDVCCIEVPYEAYQTRAERLIEMRRGLSFDRPASWTSGHHLVHWIHGGPSDLQNLALLCYRHHWNVHEGGWQLVRTETGKFMTVPPTVTFGPTPRGPD